MPPGDSGSGNENGSERELLACGDEQHSPGTAATNAGCAPLLCPICLEALCEPVPLHSADPATSAANGSGTSGCRCACCRSCAADAASLRRCDGWTCPLCAARIAGDARGDIDTHNAIGGGGGGLMQPLLNPIAPAALANAAPDGAIQSAAEQACGVCEAAGGAASVGCVECGFPLCAACSEASHSKGRFRQHRIVPLERLLRASKRRCPTHPEHVLEVFCVPCAAPACVMCCLETHRRCSPVVNLASAAGDAAREIEAIRCVAEGSHNAAIAEMEAALEGEGARHRSSAAELERAVSVTFAALRAALEAREATLVTQVHALAKERAGALEEARGVLMQAAARGNSVLTAAERLVEVAHDAELVRCTPLIAARLAAMVVGSDVCGENVPSPRLPSLVPHAAPPAPLSDDWFVLEHGVPLGATLPHLLRRFELLGRICAPPPLPGEGDSRGGSGGSCSSSAVASPSPRPGGAQASSAELPLTIVSGRSAHRRASASTTSTTAASAARVTSCRHSRDSSALDKAGGEVAALGTAAPHRQFLALPMQQPVSEAPAPKAARR